MESRPCWWLFLASRGDIIATVDRVREGPSSAKVPFLQRSISRLSSIRRHDPASVHDGADAAYLDWAVIIVVFIFSKCPRKFFQAWWSRSVNRHFG